MFGSPGHQNNHQNYFVGVPLSLKHSTIQVTCLNRHKKKDFRIFKKFLTVNGKSVMYRPSWCMASNGSILRLESNHSTVSLRTIPSVSVETRYPDDSKPRISFCWGVIGIGTFFRGDFDVVFQVVEF
jgi:hypothetical protein